VPFCSLSQADGKKNRNILLSEARLETLVPQPEIAFAGIKGKFGASTMVAANLDAPATGVSGWTQDQINKLLERFNLDHTTGLSVLAVEMMPRYDQYILFSSQPPDKSVRPLSQQLASIVS
jgi:hypothetical protein